MLHTSFMEIGLLVPEKKNFEGFLPFWYWRQSWSFDQHHIIFICMYQKAYTQNLVKNGPVVSEKSKF